MQKQDGASHHPKPMGTWLRYSDERKKENSWVFQLWAKWLFQRLSRDLQPPWHSCNGEGRSASPEGRAACVSIAIHLPRSTRRWWRWTLPLAGGAHSLHVGGIIKMWYANSYLHVLVCRGGTNTKKIFLSKNYLGGEFTFSFSLFPLGSMA